MAINLIVAAVTLLMAGFVAVWTLSLASGLDGVAERSL